MSINTMPDLIKKEQDSLYHLQKLKLKQLISKEDSLVSPTLNYVK